MSPTPGANGLPNIGYIDRVSFSEILVDFFGSLVPGLIFVIGLFVLAVLNLVSWLALLSRLLQVPSFRTVTTLQTAGNLLSPYWLGLLLFVLILGFVAGHFFFRQDPKNPDIASFERIRGEMSDLGKWVISDPEGRNNNGNFEFPYPNLYGYLESRGLNHLAQMVSWRKEDFGAGAPEPKPERLGEVRRTKNFINILKIRLSFHFPDKLSAITRNEAHIRLMSSTWYMARDMARLSLISLASSTFSLTWAMSLWEYRQYQFRVLAYVLPVFSSLAIFLIALRAKQLIERSLHYQRVREIVFVLETAYTAFKDKPEILHDICPAFESRREPTPLARTGTGDHPPEGTPTHL